MSIEVMKRLVAAVEAIPEEVEGWMPDALTDALIDARQAIAEAEKQEPVVINCKAKRENNGVCPHHNLHCGWPKCNEPAWDCCANCMRLEHEHVDGRCPKPFTTVWHEWDYEFPPNTHPQPKREPLTHEQAKALVAKYGHDPLYLVLQTEAAHGIKGDA